MACPDSFHPGITSLPSDSFHFGKLSGYLNPHNAFTVGVFSTLNIFLNEPMEALLAKIQLNELLVEALLYKKGELGAILQVTLDYEAANFSQLEQTHYNKHDLTYSYLAGIEYANSVISILNQ